MKSLFFYILFLVTFTLRAADLVELRNLLFVAPNSEATTKLIIEKTKYANESTAVLMGLKQPQQCLWLNMLCYLLLSMPTLMKVELC